MQKQLSSRVPQTDFPLMSELQSLVALPGQTWWSPPPLALASVSQTLQTGTLDKYCKSVFGMDTLHHAITKSKQCQASKICVTQGANQGFYNLVLALCDAQDAAVLFTPYYFNHLMALQMSNVVPVLIKVQDETLLPDLQQVEQALQNDTAGKIKMVIVCSPCNPTGVVWPREQMLALSDICSKYGKWLVCDDAYDMFVFNDTVQYAPLEHDHVIHLGSFSKSHGMHGWRCGYIAYPANNTELQC